MIRKLTILNETILDLLNERSEAKIVKAFTQLAVKILGADFGFVWLQEATNQKWSLVYKTPNLPFHPHKPRATGINYKVMTSGKIEYFKKFKNTPSNSHVGKHMKSFVIIPISFKEKSYGTIVVCFKKTESFSREKKVLCIFLGNGIAQVINIKQSYERTEKLKTTALLLNQEKLKTEFLANATHELRTPVAIIKGNVDLGLLDKKRDLKSIKNILKEIDEETKHLSKILSDLTIITSRKTDFKNKLLIENINLNRFVKKITKRFKILAQKKNIKIIQSKISNISIEGSRVYLEKMLANLIKNSIMYGKINGHTKIKFVLSKKSISIYIEDDGIGIPKEDLPHIFERFYRADKSHNGDNNSTGLGLAIVKWVAEIHDGTVSVKSILGKGSVFNVTLPIKTTK